MRRLGRAFFYSLILTAVVLITPTLETKAQDSTDKNAKPLLIEEFADLQCPSCRSHHFILKRLKDNYGDRIKIKYYHFPLRSHQYAMPAARATEAARNQGKFLEMKDLLFERQHEWPGNEFSSYIMDYARELDLDASQFQEDLNSQSVQQRVIEDREEGRKRGVRATPTFFVNGEQIEYPTSYEEFKQVLENRLAKQTKSK